MRRKIYKNGNHSQLATSLDHVAWCYECLNDFPKSLEHYQQAL